MTVQLQEAIDRILCHSRPRFSEVIGDRTLD